MALALLLGSVSTLSPTPAWARDQAIHISSHSLAEALHELSHQSGISVGMEGPVPNIPVPPIDGHMSAERALRQLLRETNLVARKVGDNIYRLEQRHLLPRSPVMAAQPIALLTAAIVVTASKRKESLLDVPLSLSVVTLSNGSSAGKVMRTADIADQIEGLALTNIGPGHNRQFIRGVADSPFTGPSQSTVSLAIDDTRATYSAPDPDLRLVDVERVELLKGPQGPLYGTGALGGVYHIVTRKPDLERITGYASIDGFLINQGNHGVGGEAVFNLPLVQDHVGLRAVVYADREPGWIDTLIGDDRNYAKTTGGRLALRAVPAEGWTLDILGVAQWLHVDDSQYVFSPHSRFRNTIVAEPQDNDFHSVSASVHGTIGGNQLTTAVGLVSHEVTAGLDATASAPALAVNGPTFVQDERQYRIFDSELRLSGETSSALQWLIGVSYLDAANRQSSTLTTTAASIEQQLLDWRQQVGEWALFGELSVPLLPEIRAIAGTRLFHWDIENKAGVGTAGNQNSRRKTGVTPSLSLQWRPDDRTMVFARYSTAFRPGGLSPTGEADGAYDSDELNNFEIGTRLIRSHGLSLSAAIYHTRWLHIQTDTLLENGLVTTRNAGNGSINGVEVSAKIDLLKGWVVDGGAQIQHARLTKSLSDTIAVEDRRLPVVPDLTFRLGTKHSISIGGWRGNAGIAGRYNGKARLSLDPDLDRKMGGYIMVDLSGTLSKGHWTVDASVSNLLDSQADSFAFGNPFSIRQMQQFTPLRPRMLRISLARHW